MPPRIVIIVPAYGHPVLLTEAVDSALAQTGAPPLAILLVSDGCRQPETDQLCAAYATAHPQVIYLRKANGGPSSARNYGIDYVLRRWPDLDAVFFLDSDNRLSPTAMRDAHAAWAAHPGIGWIFPDITSFGLAWTANYGIPYSPLLHVVYDNICDTGSLVSRPVLEAGVRFDEDARSGYEDWDFWLQCLDHGFRGQHAPFGFAYRQRPESRFREMNRKRGAMVEHLRGRHPTISRAANLIGWEHETNPRFLYRGSDADGSFAFTDPTRRGAARSPADVADTYFAALHQPDECYMPPYFAWGDDAALAELERLRLAQGLFLLLERQAAHANFAVLSFVPTANEISLNIHPVEDPTTIRERGRIWLCCAKLLHEVVQDEQDAWINSLDSATPGPTMIEIVVHAPFGALPDSGAVSAILASVQNLRASPYRASPVAAWNWRPRHFPARSDYYDHLCRYLDVPRLLPRVKTRRVEVAVLLPIASYGGAEKVAYAMARSLRDDMPDLEIGVHLFIVGPPKMRMIPEYDGVFETVTFLADADFPLWGGPATNFGQEVFLPDAPEITDSGLVGLLTGFDMVVNCHSAPANSMMGMLRARKIRTATYLHVFDTTPRRRLVGHPYLTIGFEHAYDLVLTCSQQLADDLHGLGVPAGKILPIRNAASFSIPDTVRDAQRRHRETPRRRRKLRALYLGRLDRQKGVERLLGAARLLQDRGVDLEWRIVGSGLLEEGGVDWFAAFAQLGITVEPPAYASEQLAEIYGWADVLILPSRWEGAPLVIPEAHSLGCIPIATDVGAVAELLIDNVDGVLISGQGSDDAIAIAMADAVQAIEADDAVRLRMAQAAMRSAESHGWSKNFAPLGDWMWRQFSPPAVDHESMSDTKTVQG